MWELGQLASLAYWAPCCVLVCDHGGLISQLESGKMGPSKGLQNRVQEAVLCTIWRSRDVPAPDNKSLGCCCRNSLPTVINPDYNMTKQRYITRIYDKIRSKSRPNRATSPTCLHCDVTHLSLTAGVVALHIPSRRFEVREEHRQARKTVWPVNVGRVICPYQNNLCGIINHHKHIWECFYDV